ncbi:MAG TPA: acyltransferase [Roseiarcus sp.]|jgi:peptidoglycan/LPS O-acetylase OafA/YrhL
MTRAPSRIASIDGLRGLLAAYVMLWHFLAHSPVHAYAPPGTLAVYCFFVMSGYVLTLAWTSDFPVFLLRRFLRLWPVYAVALASGALLSRVDVGWTDFAFYPLTPSVAIWRIDSPIWSLYVEAWAMLAMPFIVWSGKTAPRAAIAILVFVIAGCFELRMACGIFFVVGSHLARYRFDFAALNGSIPQWLGKISYSLYLTHFIVFKTCDAWFQGIDRFLELPIAIAVGYLVWVGIERYSIDLSRKAARYIRPLRSWRPLASAYRVERSRRAADLHDPSQQHRRAEARRTALQ